MVFPWAVIGGAVFRAGVPLTWSTCAHGSLSSPRARTGLPGICAGCWAPSVSPAPLTSLSRGMCLWPQGRPWQRMCPVPWGFNNVMLPNPVWRHPSRPGTSMCIPKVLTSRVHEAKMYWAPRLTIRSTFHSHSISELEGTLRDHFQSPHLTEKGHPETSDDLARRSWHFWAARVRTWAQASSSSSRSSCPAAGRGRLSQHLVHCGRKHLHHITWGPSRRQIPGPHSRRTDSASGRARSQQPAFGTDFLGDSPHRYVKTGGRDPLDLTLALPFSVQPQT